MNILIVTQVMDTEDPVLGFFTAWVAAFAKKFNKVVVICLKEGTHALPANVSVYSLGKEKGKVSRLTYAFRFWKLIRRHKKEYDAVFVHMNQEYILLGARLWKKWGKKIYMWRNHYAGNRSTDRTIAKCDKVFSTSRYSYTAHFPNNVLMPVGVDTEIFAPMTDVPRDPQSLLSLGRIAPSKRIDMLLHALKLLKDKKISFSASLYGSALPQDTAYFESLKALTAELDLEKQVTFYPAVAPRETPKIYAAHGIFVNCSQSGMYDKTLFEAMASECLLVASSQDLKEIVPAQYSFREGDTDDLARKLEALLSLSFHDRQGMGVQLRNIAKTHSLEALLDKLCSVIIA